jgi:hypothetical protein
MEVELEGVWSPHSLEVGEWVRIGRSHASTKTKKKKKENNSKREVSQKTRGTAHEWEVREILGVWSPREGKREI